MDVQVVLRFDNRHDGDLFFAVGGASSGARYKENKKLEG